MSAAAAAEGGGAVTKVHWNRVGGVGAVGIGLLLFVGGIMVGGEGEYLRVRGQVSALPLSLSPHSVARGLQEQKRLKAVEMHYSKLKAQAAQTADLQQRYDHELELERKAKAMLAEEIAKEKELAEDLEAEHEVAEKMQLLSGSAKVTSDATVDVLVRPCPAPTSKAP